MLDTARTLFAERGSDVDMREICERSGIGIGTLYRNFASKDELVTAIKDELLEQGRNLLDRAEAVDDPFEGLKIVLNGMWELAETRGRLMAELGALTSPKREEGAEDIRATMRKLFQRLQDDGRLRSGLDPALAEGFIGSLFPLYINLRQSFEAEQVRAQLTLLAISSVVVTPA
ncbi:MAG: TetR/AcrR family transcriptional regulator [Dehalococcoidia bacterium]